MPFRIEALSEDLFAPLKDLSTEDLARHGAVRRTVTSKPGFPCRVSLADAEVGEDILLVHYEHHSADSPFRASHAVYVRPDATRAVLAPGEVPAVLRSRVLSLRAFDQGGMMRDADLVDGRDVEVLAERMLSEPATAYVHAHFAKPGCYAARIVRA